jgi:hypothetical protein
MVIRPTAASLASPRWRCTSALSAADISWRSHPLIIPDQRSTFDFFGCIKWNLATPSAAYRGLRAGKYAGRGCTQVLACHTVRACAECMAAVLL